MRIIDLGLVAYAVALRAQNEAVLRVRTGGGESLFLLEHQPVITFGRNGGEEYLPFGRAFFAERGVEFAHSARGGSITCHFPGQLVAYPILRVDRRPGGLRRFFFDLEESVIRTLDRFGLDSGRISGRPGVWIGDRKICSTGIAVKHWVTSHGLSLNVAEDLSLFSLVTPCGLPGVRATSLHRELGDAAIGMERVKEVFAEEFRALFSPEQRQDTEENEERHDHVR
jgi:lipoyl(octanoyl) transferase